MKKLLIILLLLIPTQALAFDIKEPCLIMKRAGLETNCERMEINDNDGIGYTGNTDTIYFNKLIYMRLMNEGDIYSIETAFVHELLHRYDALKGNIMKHAEQSLLCMEIYTDYIARRLVKQWNEVNFMPLQVGYSTYKLAKIYDSKSIDTVINDFFPKETIDCSFLQ